MRGRGYKAPPIVSTAIPQGFQHTFAQRTMHVSSIFLFNFLIT